MSQALSSVSHVIVDECHERDLDTDFLLIILRELLKSRTDLKVVLMSATIQAQVFVEYFDNCNAIEIPGRTFPVTHYLLEDAIAWSNFVVEPGSEFARKEEVPMAERREMSDTYMGVRTAERSPPAKVG